MAVSGRLHELEVALPGDTEGELAGSRPPTPRRSRRTPSRRRGPRAPARAPALALTARRPSTIYAEGLELSLTDDDSGGVLGVMTFDVRRS